LVLCFYIKLVLEATSYQKNVIKYFEFFILVISLRWQLLLGRDFLSVTATINRQGYILGSIAGLKLLTVSEEFVELIECFAAFFYF